MSDFLKSFADAAPWTMAVLLVYGVIFAIRALWKTIRP